MHAHLMPEQADPNGSVEDDSEEVRQQLPGLARHKVPHGHVGCLGVDPAPAGLGDLGVIA